MFGQNILFSGLSIKSKSMEMSVKILKKRFFFIRSVFGHDAAVIVKIKKPAKIKWFWYTIKMSFNLCHPSV